MRNVFLFLIVLFWFSELVSGEECQILNGKLKCSRLVNIPRLGGRYLAAELVDFSRNSITLVKSTSFKDFSSIRYVNLSKNAIERVEPGTFQHKNYQWIDLSHNNLSTLSREVFPDDSVLQKKLLNVYLHHNPWDCTCALKWMVDLIKETLIRPRLTQPTCYTPYNVKGKSLVLLEDDDYCVIQECLECDDAANCKVNGSEYQCVCKSNYNGNGKFCADIDECTSHDVCKPNEMCENFSGGYKCACAAGFKRKDGECKDYNECEPPPIGCGPAQGMCKNTIGSYKCFCHPGLQNVKGRGCIDVDECDSEVNPCKHIAHITCINTPILDIGDQGFECRCDDGYVMSGEACITRDDGSTTTMYLVGGLGGFTVLLVIIIVIVILWRGLRELKPEKQERFMMAPVTMATPMEFGFLEMPQEQAGYEENEEWRDEDSDDF